MHRSHKLFAIAMILTAWPLAAGAQNFTTRKFNIGGEGGFDYLSVDPATSRVFVSRGTHIMVVDASTGKLLGDITNTPRTHGALLVPSAGHGFTTNAGDSTSTMFDMKTLVVIKKIPLGVDGADGFMYDDATNNALVIDHSRPIGTAIVINATTGAVVHKIALSANAPEGGVSDGNGRIFINLENGNAVDVVDTRTWTVVKQWPLAPCDGPTGIAMDRVSNRIFVGCGEQSIVLDATTGKVVATIPNGDGVDGIAWDQSQKLIYIPSGASGNVTVVHEDSPDKYSVVATVPTMRGARTITVDTQTHTAYVFTPTYGPVPANAMTLPNGRRPRGPITGAWLIAIKH
jgi:DNA-binding beta-propeller fold protein YncE